ncbi:MAG: GTP-binding protein [Bacillota bacterium]|uniref:CobW family GTP-binding protein n=1 Tax=Desulfitobacterium hafniense TaxID=49338 RepID=UPI0003621AB9|nr:GTP-binding protein [Desulfitobacterium hafniense]
MIKLDIISGFLGSGKTTLIHRILGALEEENVVIIENEYGELPIDSEILRVAGFEIYELTNGCVCCTLKEDFCLTLLHILDQQVDRIIFEPSGIFILSEIFDLFKDELIASRCALNSLITVVDGLNFHKHSQGITGFFANQIESATSLVISKTPLLADEEVETIVRELSLMNGTAEIIALDWQELSPRLIRRLLNPQEQPDRPRHSHHSLDHGFKTLGFRTKKIFDLKNLQLRLKEIKDGLYGRVIRAKGFVQGRDAALEFSYVYGIYDIKTVQGGILEAVSFIGNDLDEEGLKRAFNGSF